MSRPTQITIDISALRHNLARVKKFAPRSHVLAMVKSNAYGHGIERIALALPEADALGVASLEEGLQLRQAGVKTPICLMEGLFSSHELTLAAENEFTLIIHEIHQVKMLEKYYKVNNPFSVWLKIDTGMHRLGFQPHEVLDMYNRLQACASVRKPVGLMTHFAMADALEKNHTAQQIELFHAVTTNLEGPRSLANSAAIVAWPVAHADWVRPGILLYGASPMAGCHGADHGLRPVMSLTSELIAIHRVKQGERVGYGGVWTCPEDMMIGIVAIGYGDGYPRHTKNGAPVLVNGQPCPLVGRVAMDMLTVDLRSQPAAKRGDPVLLWGPGLPVEVVAEYSETTAYELLTRITQRVRVVMHVEEQVPLRAEDPIQLTETTN